MKARKSIDSSTEKLNNKGRQLQHVKTPERKITPKKIEYPETDNDVHKTNSILKDPDKAKLIENAN